MESSRLFILGADDPEMRAIEKILRWDEQEFTYATKGGKRVHPGNSYQADSIGGDAFEQIVLIECQPISLPSGIEIVRIDHHRPGDRGYGMPPSQFWHASSIGQLSDFLGVSMEVGSHDNVILAAMDHCPAAAIRGECPGVTAQEVLNRKVAEIAAASGHSPQGVLSRVAFFTEKIENAPEISISMEGGMLRDMRTWDTGCGYSLDYLCLQVATLAGGYGVLQLTHDRDDPRDKWTVAGHASPEIIEAFMKYWAPSKGLVGIYGVPNRGYAGGYLPA